MISTALAATLVDEFGPTRPCSYRGRALREMTRISGSPYSMWRDIAITNKKNLADALHKLEQRLATSAKSGLEATGGRIRARPRVEKNSATETCRQERNKK